MTPSPTTSLNSRMRWPVALAVGVLFTAYSFWTASIPGSNESHYLCKAKFWWQPEWCDRDLFLSSSNPHFVFYAVLGWLAQWLSLETVAILGRITGYLALGFGWEALARSLRLSGRATLTAAVLLLVSAATVSLSGEWLVGGIESKVYAYAAVFAGLGACFERRWIYAGIALGLAIAFHPLVGVWSVAALLIATVWSGLMARLSRRRLTLRVEPFANNSLDPLNSLDSESQATSAADSSDRPLGTPQKTSILTAKQSKSSPRQLAIGILLCFAIALTGLIPALQSISGSDAAASVNATFIQVFYRLRHHLHPDAFPLTGYLTYIGMLFLAGILVGRRIPTSSVINMRRVVWGAVLIAACGWIAGYGLIPANFGQPLFTLRMTALKFYPFRFVDALVPVFMSLMLAQAWDETAQWRPSSRRARWLPVLLVLLSLFAFERGRGAGAARYLPDEREQDWLAVCRWVSERSPRDALFVTPNESWAFKWYAQRAEYVAFKDCPQDARSLCEWNERLQWLGKWAERGFLDTTYSQTEIRELQQHTGATHFITRRPARLDARELYSNASYVIYEL